MDDAVWVPTDLERLPDIPFTCQAPHGLRLDIYRRREPPPPGPRPVVLWLHGGGWIAGDKDLGVERIFAMVRAGFIGASANYRLSSEAIFPAQLHDVKCAVRYLRAHAGDHDMDPDRIGAWGASAGGHLASLLAVAGQKGDLEGDRGWAGTSSAVQAACAWFAPSDLNLMDRFPQGITPRLPSMTAESAEGRLVGGAVADRQELVSLANPIRYAHPDAAPLLLMHGARDDAVPLASSERLHEALIAAGASSTLHVIKEGHHNAWLWGDHHLRLVQEFFEWHLRSR